MVIDVRGQTIEETHQNILFEAKKLGMEGIRTVCEQCGEEVYAFRDDLIDEEGYYKDLCRCGGRISARQLTEMCRNEV